MKGRTDFCNQNALPPIFSQVKRIFSLFPAVLAILALLTLPTAAASSKPNVVLIMTDDFGFECVGANGSNSYKTPNLDRLAATGMRFENCHVQPLCTPTRVQLMTGQYNIRNYKEFGYMEPDSRTFANLFKKAGYATCIAGKWQLGTDPSLPKRWGFDEHCLWQFTRRPERYRNPGLEVNGKEMDYTKGEYGPDIVNDYALDFISRHQSKPFLLYYPMILTHDPVVPTPDSPDYNKPEAHQKNKDNKYFPDMVAYADKLVGKIAAKLDELKIRENTLIIFLGDNGTHSSITSQFRGKAYEGGKGKRINTGSHVPLIVNYPNTVPAGKVNANLVDSTDFFPTICEAAGISIPNKMTLDGKSFWSQLQGKPGSSRDWSYTWYAPRANKLQFEYARDVRFKLYRDGSFYDVEKDPGETSPLDNSSLSAENKQVKAKLTKVLEEYKNARPSHYATGETTVPKTEKEKKPKGKKRKQAAS